MHAGHGGVCNADASDLRSAGGAMWPDAGRSGGGWGAVGGDCDNERRLRKFLVYGKSIRV